jgi:hypothetical protein
MHVRQHEQSKYQGGRHHDPGFVIQPGTKRDFEGIGHELGAVFAIEVVANLAEPPA